MIRTTERLLLRDFRADDWPAVLAYQASPRDLQYYAWTERGEADVRAFVQRFLDQQAEQPRWRWRGFAIVLAATGALIGNCGLRLDAPGARTGNIGYELAPPPGITATPPRPRAKWSGSASRNLACTASGRNVWPITPHRRECWRRSACGARAACVRPTGSKAAGGMGDLRHARRRVAGSHGDHSRRAYVKPGGASMAPPGLSDVRYVRASRYWRPLRCDLSSISRPGARCRCRNAGRPRGSLHFAAAWTIISGCTFTRAQPAGYLVPPGPLVASVPLPLRHASPLTRLPGRNRYLLLSSTLRPSRGACPRRLLLLRCRAITVRQRRARIASVRACCRRFRQAWAIFAAVRRHRQRQHDRLTQRFAQVEHMRVADGEEVFLVLTFRRGRQRVAVRQIDCRAVLTAKVASMGASKSSRQRIHCSVTVVATCPSASRPAGMCVTSPLPPLPVRPAPRQAAAPRV